MDTEEIKGTQAGGNAGKADNSSKAKKAAGKAAQFAAAAGLGAGGTIAAQAMTEDVVEPEELTDGGNAATTANTTGEHQADDVVMPEEINPNDVMLDGGDEPVNPEHASETADDHGPITAENVADGPVEIETAQVDVDGPGVDDPEITDDPGILEDPYTDDLTAPVDGPDLDIADTGDIDDPDIAGDLL